MDETYPSEYYRGVPFKRSLKGVDIAVTRSADWWRAREDMLDRARIQIPEGYQSSYRDVEEWRRRRGRVLYVAKGPSAARASDYIRYAGTVATVNEAILLVPYSDYAFFSDENALMNCRAHWHRIGKFVCPAYVHKDQRGVGSIPVTDVLGHDRNVVVTHRSQMDWDPKKVEESVDAEELLTTDTSVMGLHFLHLAGFTDFLLYGHDGGIGYADGVPCLRQDRDMQRFREKIEFVSNELSLHHGTRIEFADGKVIE